jgi:hypothetical protein
VVLASQPVYLNQQSFSEKGYSALDIITSNEFCPPSQAVKAAWHGKPIKNNNNNSKSSSGKRSSSASSDEEDESDDEGSDSDDEVTITKAGKRVKVKLDPIDKAICDTLGPYFDLLYTKLEPGVMRGVIERINSSETFLSDVQIAPATKKNPLDKEGAMMQRDSLLIAKAAADCVKKIATLSTTNEEQAKIAAKNLACIDLKDIMLLASQLGIRGSIKRVYTRDKKIGQILMHNINVPIYTDVMKAEVKDVFKNYSFIGGLFSTNNGYGYARRQYRGGMGAGYNRYNNSYTRPKPPFFLAGEVCKEPRQLPIPKILPAIFPEYNSREYKISRYSSKKVLMEKVLREWWVKY